MSDPSIERFKRVVAAAYGSLEARRQEVNDLNVFPVADGDTGDNMDQALARAGGGGKRDSGANAARAVLRMNEIRRELSS